MDTLRVSLLPGVALLAFGAAETAAQTRAPLQLEAETWWDAASVGVQQGVAPSGAYADPRFAPQGFAPQGFAPQGFSSPEFSSQGYAPYGQAPPRFDGPDFRGLRPPERQPLPHANPNRGFASVWVPVAWAPIVLPRDFDDRFEARLDPRGLERLLGRQAMMNLRGHARVIRARGPLHGRAVNLGWRGAVIQVRSETTPVAELLDANRDHVIDAVHLFDPTGSRAHRVDAGLRQPFGGGPQGDPMPGWVSSTLPGRWNFHHENVDYALGIEARRGQIFATVAPYQSQRAFQFLGSSMLGPDMLVLHFGAGPYGTFDVEVLADGRGSARFGGHPALPIRLWGARDTSFLPGGLQAMYYPDFSTYRRARSEGEGSRGWSPGQGLVPRASLVRHELMVDSDWRYGPPAPSLPQHGFTGFWSGDFVVPTTGVYTIAAATTDFVEVSLDGQYLNYQEQPVSTHYQRQVHLEAGHPYWLQAAYANQSPDSKVALMISGPGVPMQVLR